MRWRRDRASAQPADSAPTVPTISVVVVVYDMPKQAMNTLYTLSRRYQRGVQDVSYEVVVVENLSKHNLKQRKVEALGPEFRYIARRESGVSPVWALREGIEAARGEVIGIMIDGARMVTPGVIRNVADAYRAFPDAVVSTAGFHLGEEDHQHRHSAADDMRLLRRLSWKKDGYLLYTAATIGGGNPFGYLHPFMESNCMFATRRAIDAIGGPDVRFDQVGGGSLNPDLYRELVNLPETQLVILPGEASFHQFHGGVTTRQDSDRSQLMEDFKQRYQEIRGTEFFSPTKEPFLLGEVSPYALPMLHYSAFQSRTRFEAFTRLPVPTKTWEDDMIVLSRDILDDPFGGVDDDQEGSELSIYLPPSLRHFFPRHIVFSTWIDHIQFGYDLVAATKPKRLVELGTQSGMSYFAFCQSVQENDLDTICYAVDTWEGEHHTGKYDESTWEMVSQVNRLNYTGFSYLMRMYFNEAVDHFEDESIDLLHIDGLHTYEAVREDFETWAPKVSPGGIVLFHDIAARMKDFGVWKFWDELRQNEKDTFEFYHGFGLGVWRKPGGEPSTEPLLRYMFDSTPGEQDELRRFYVFDSMYHDYRRKATGGS